MEDQQQSPRKHRARTIGAILASTAVVTAGVLIIARKPLATEIVDSRFARAGVPYAYRITGLSPFTQTIEDVRLGDAAHPDLVAKRITIGWRYRLGWPVLDRVRIEGGDLGAKWEGGRLSLGSLDKLLPRTGNGGPALPDIDATIVDSRLRLLTPAGLVTTRIAGQGNLADGFHGRLALTAPALAIGGCAIEGLRADVAIAFEQRSPLLKGPLAIDHAICPTRTLMLGAGRVALDIRIAPDLAGASGHVAPEGLAGRSGAIAFGALTGNLSGKVDARGGKGDADLALASIAAAGAHADHTQVNGAWSIGKAGVGYEGGVRLAGLVAPESWARAIAGVAPATARTPVAPIADRVSTLLTDLARRSDVEGQMMFGPGGLRLDGVTLRSRRGAVTIGGAYRPDPGGWTADAELAEVTSTLPPITVHAERHGALKARIVAAPFEVPGARLAFAPVLIANGRFATAITADGPLASGRIEGLHAPVTGSFGAKGVRIGEGCTKVGFQSVTLAALRLDPASFSLCGAPLYADGRIAAQARDIRLTGRSGSTPLALTAATLGWVNGTLRGSQIAARLGEGDDPTRLQIAAIEGAPGPQGFGGRFLDAEGAIGHVPLALSGGTGEWGFANGALHLKGALRIADRAGSPRFKPLASGDVALALLDGHITGTASLTPSGRREIVAKVSLHHDLGTGIGEAALDVPGIAFAKRGLQPEMLTPLTLGIVANASGTVAGQGHIVWNPKATTSTGDLHTDNMDFAAAFGPVTGVATNIHFTDLLGLVSAPHQEVRVATLNPGVVVSDGVAHVQLLPGNRVAVEDARWPFAAGLLSLEPATLDFSHPTERHLTFTIDRLDAATFIQQLDFPNIAATGTFNGRLPMIFDADGGRIEGGSLIARGPGTLAYVGELSNADIGAMGKLAFDALKAIRYSALTISLDGKLDGEIISRVKFDGVRQATPGKGIVARAIRNLPFRFNIAIRAPFRGLVGSARSYADPELLLKNIQAPVQPAATPPVR